MEGTPFGRYVRARRMEAGLSLRAVADAVGLTHVYLGEIERGVRSPLKPERWDALVSAIPGMTKEGLKRAADTTRPVQISIDDAPPQYQDLALALARRIRERDLRAPQIEEILAVLEREEE